MEFYNIGKNNVKCSIIGFKTYNEPISLVYIYGQRWILDTELAVILSITAKTIRKKVRKMSSSCMMEVYKDLWTCLNNSKECNYYQRGGQAPFLINLNGLLKLKEVLRNNNDKKIISCLIQTMAGIEVKYVVTPEQMVNQLDNPYLVQESMSHFKDYSELLMAMGETNLSVIMESFKLNFPEKFKYLHSLTQQLENLKKKDKEVEFLEPSSLGMKMGLHTSSQEAGKLLNKFLEQMHLQTKNESGKWKPTNEGGNLCKVNKFIANNGHRGWNLIWNSEAVMDLYNKMSK